MTTAAALAPRLTSDERPIRPHQAPISPLTGLYRGAKTDPLHFFLTMGGTRDVVEFKNPNGPFFLVNDADMIEHILQGNYKNYPKSTYYHRLKPLFGEGLFELEGEAWRVKRQTIQPAFDRKKMDDLSTLMTDEIAAFLDSWTPKAKSGEAFDIAPHMMHMTFKIITKALCNAEIPGDMAQLSSSLTTIMREGERILWAIFPALYSLPTPRRAKVRQALKHFTGVMSALIARRCEDVGERGDLLDMLLAAKDPDTGAPLSPEVLRDDLMTMLLAGHETTAMSLTWICAHLSLNPEVARRLKAEALSVLGPERRPTLDDLPDMPYSRMVVEESLRLYPPFWTLSRQVKEDDRLGDYRLPAGATVMISPYVTHRNPRYWDNPEGFDPERFSPERSEHRPKFAYFPFGGGPRVCVGRNMALMEAQLFLAMLVRRYSVSLSPGHKVEPSPMISLRPKNGVRMTVAAAG